MQVFKTKEFGRFSRKERISDDLLCEAIARAERGLIDADLGGGVIKQRIARLGQGRSGGYRTIIAFRSGARSIFMYGFAKSAMANLSDKELAVYKQLAQILLGAGDAQMAKMRANGELIEVDRDDR